MSMYKFSIFLGLVLENSVTSRHLSILLISTLILYFLQIIINLN
jgi:hypothetical protein